MIVQLSADPRITLAMLEAAGPVAGLSLLPLMQMELTLVGGGNLGLPGTPGTPGEDGADGESAYEIAVRNGFEGTEEEWLDSLAAGGMDPDITNALEAADNPSATNPYSTESNTLALIIALGG